MVRAAARAGSGGAVAVLDVLALDREGRAYRRGWPRPRPPPEQAWLGEVSAVVLQKAL